MDMKIRLLHADEIECRAAAVNANGVSLLLYKDARVDQRILDETFGIFGWKRSHQILDGSLYCTVEVYDRESGEWVAKQDVGTTGFSEKEKSQASDSFKRACFNWGIGRELYTAPPVWIPAAKTEIRKKGDRYYCAGSFSVSSISHGASREIEALEIADGKGTAVYGWKKPKGAQARQGMTGERMRALETELERTGVGMEAVKERYHIRDMEQMPEEIYGKVMRALARTRSAGAQT